MRVVHWLPAGGRRVDGVHHVIVRRPQPLNPPITGPHHAAPRVVTPLRAAPASHEDLQVRNSSQPRRLSQPQHVAAALFRVGERKVDRSVP